jgi:FAD binding domain
VTPYSFLEIFPQDEHERLLIARLEELGVSVERQTELIGYRDEGDRIAAGLRRSDSREETCEADYIAGCDGVHSIVRETMGADFRAAPIATFLMSPTAFSKKRVGSRLDADQIVRKSTILLLKQSLRVQGGRGQVGRRFTLLEMPEMSVGGVDSGNPA